MASVVTGLGGSIGLGENSIWHGSGVDFGNMDDGAVQVDITSVFGAGGIDFFGTNYTSLYIDTNGTITFDGPELSYTPAGVAGLTYPAIAPFFTDVDIGAYGHINGANDIYWDLDTVNNVFTVTWYEVIPYSGTGNNTFQVRIHDLGGGDFDVEFIYEDIEWTDGGFGVASVGMTDGGANDYVLPGSQNASELSNYPTADFGTGDGPGIYSLAYSDGAPVCFVEGTGIQTPSGLRRVEDLRIGDLVTTRQHGAQRLRWVGGARFWVTDRFRPVPGSGLAAAPGLRDVCRGAGCGGGETSGGVARRDVGLVCADGLVSSPAVRPASGCLRGWPLVRDLASRRSAALESLAHHEGRRTGAGHCRVAGLACGAQPEWQADGGGSGAKRV